VSPDFSALADPVILLGLIFTAAIILLVRSWRYALLALLLQYLFVGLLLMTFLSFNVAIVRVVSGVFISIILFITMRQMEEADRRTRMDPTDPSLDRATARLYLPRIFHVDFPFRLIAVAFVTVSIVGASSSMSFLGIPAYILFGSLWLISAGILVSVLSREVARLGLGIMMFMSGFCILEMAIEASLFLYGLLNIADLLLALVVAHLVTLRIELGAMP
jgi:hypothetical protein